MTDPRPPAGRNTPPPQGSSDPNIPDAATAEELERWWMLRAAFYLKGSTRFGDSWSTLFSEEDEPKRLLYLAGMNAAYEALPELDRKVLALRQIADAADGIPIKTLEQVLGMSLLDIVAVEKDVQERLRRMGDGLWSRLG